MGENCCVHCGVIGALEQHHIDKQGVKTYRCKDCKKTFIELYGTIYYRSKIPLWIWLSALLEITIATGSVPAAELSRRYPITHVSTWKMMNKIKEKLFKSQDNAQLNNLVEADEAWFGKKNNQDIILGIVQRNKRKLMLTTIPNVKEKTLYPLIEKHVKHGSHFFTDSRITYSATAVYYKHRTTNHSKGEFARDGFIHSNTIEQIWGDIKGIIRTIHHGISKKYRMLYLNLYALKYEHLHNSNLFYFFLSKHLECLLLNFLR